MTVDTAPSCATSPADVAVQDSLPVDPNAWPVLATYRDVGFTSGGGALRLDVSCTIAPTSGSQTYQFQIPLFLCVEQGMGAVLDFSDQDCTEATLASTLQAQGCPYLTSTPSSSDPSAYSLDASNEELQVFSAPLVNDAPDATPALAVDIQVLLRRLLGHEEQHAVLAGAGPCPLRPPQRLPELVIGRRDMSRRSIPVLLLALVAAIGAPATARAAAQTLGELTIADDGRYVWCRSSALAGDGCGDASAPLRGSLVPAGVGFRLSGVPGTYAAYRPGAAVAIFPIDSLSPRLMALSLSSDPPGGSFYQVTRDAGSGSGRVELSFADETLEVKGLPGWDGTYPYRADRGTLSVAGARCPGGVCRGIYNDELAIVYVAGIGNSTFVR